MGTHSSKTGGKLDWVGGIFYRQETTDIQEHEFYPGYNDYFNACVPVYGVSNGDGVTPSQCGIGETVYTPGNPPNTVEGVPIIKDQAYIGDFETHFKDTAVFGGAANFKAAVKNHHRQYQPELIAVATTCSRSSGGGRCGPGARPRSMGGCC